MQSDKKSLKEILLEENIFKNREVNTITVLNVLCMSFFILYPLNSIKNESNSLPEFFQLILAQKTAIIFIFLSAIAIIITNKKLLGKCFLSLAISGIIFVLSMMCIGLYVVEII